MKNLLKVSLAVVLLSNCAYAGFNVLYLESICNDPVLIEKNCEMKLNSPGIFQLY